MMSFIYNVMAHCTDTYMCVFSDSIEKSGKAVKEMIQLSEMGPRER